MGYELTAKTSAGKQFQDAARQHIATFRERAPAADSSAEIEERNFSDLQSSGFASAFVPEACGGWGLESVHDWIAGLATLARGDGSTAIAICMHLSVSRGMAAAYNLAIATNKDPAGPAAPLTAIADGKMLICATATERGTDNLHPMTEAVLTDDGYLINGAKMFVTMSPIATHLAMNLRMRDADGDHLVTVMLSMSTQGIEPQNDWQALGMRASGSQSINFNDVLVPKQAIRRLGTWGEWSPMLLVNRTIGNLTLVAAFLGIAEHAYELAINNVKGRNRVGQTMTTHAGIQHAVAEMDIELAKCRALMAQAGNLTDEFIAKHRDKPPTEEEAHGLMKDYQAAKWVVNRGAIDIVNQAMDLCGGGGFMTSNPLSQLYRDVRAGPFMQPFAATEMRDYVGQVALGIYPQG
ncbi:MAG: alkylation response protein AidB-like acyl-CoA dehydrogenase [Candidatus Azotimanducaceae bacterium]|jgi:alkylation response protein AidB-like acyl-CoA dehydrogenase